MTAHTPGPWEIVENDPSGSALDIESAQGGPRICTVDISGALDCTPPYTEAEVRANARLIAAAPDLLALVKTLAAGDLDIDDLNDLEDRARALLATLEP